MLLNVATLFIGTFGYRVLVGPHISILDSFYMTAITISTVGFGEVVDLSAYPAARVFTLILIFFGMGILLFIISTITSIVVEGELNHYFRRRRMEKVINKFHQHFILCGAGSVGKYIAEEMFNSDHDFVIIDSDPGRCAEMKSHYPNVPIIEGDATEEDVLISAGIKKAHAMVCVLSGDRDNLFLTLTASQLNSALRIIVKVTDIENEKKMIMAGAAECVPPQYIGALRLATQVLRPQVVGFLDQMLRVQGNFRIESVDVPESSWVVGKSLQELGLAKKVGCQVISTYSAKNDSYNFTPTGQEVIHANDTLFTICSPELLSKLRSFVA